MQRRKMLTATMIVLLCLALVATACSSGNKNDQGAATTSTPAAAVTSTPAPTTESVVPLGKYDPPIEVSIDSPIDPNFISKDGQNYTDNDWLKLYQSALGITFKYPFQAAQGDPYFTKLKVAIAGNDLPDIITVNSTILSQLVDAGQVEDLTDIYNKYASSLTKEKLNTDGGLAMKSSTFGGKLLAIPSGQGAIASTSVLWVRTDWLTKLNLPEPKTWADVVAIAQAFATKDPDGDGKADTIGLPGTKDIFSALGDLSSVFNSFHAYANNIWLPDASGQLVNGLTQTTEMKKALTALQDMYKAGILDKEFAIKDGGKVAEDFAANKVGIQYGWWWNPVWPLQGQKDKDPKAEWKAFPILSADSDPAKVSVGFPIAQWFVVKKGANHPEAIIKLLNLWYEKSYGETAEPQKYQVKADGTQVFKFVPVFGWPMGPDTRNVNVTEALTNNDPSKLNAEEKVYYDQILDYRKGNNKNWNVEMDYGPNSSEFIQSDEYVKKDLMLVSQYYGPPTPTMGDKQASLDKLYTETITKIIMGSAKVDDYDAFVDNWKKLGGDQITKEVNNWYAKNK